MTHIFRQAVACVLLDWPVLQIAVDNSFGGLFSKEKAEWLIEVTAEYIQQTEHVNSEDVREYLCTLMDQEFDTLIEDGSLELVSEKLCDLWEKYKIGKVDEVQMFLKMEAKNNHQSTLDVNSSATKNELHAGELEETKEESEDDGWTVVKRHRH